MRKNLGKTIALASAITGLAACNTPKQAQNAMHTPVKTGEISKNTSRVLKDQIAINVSSLATPAQRALLDSLKDVSYVKEIRDQQGGQYLIVLNDTASVSNLIYDLKNKGVSSFYNEEVPLLCDTAYFNSDASQQTYRWSSGAKDAQDEDQVWYLLQDSTLKDNITQPGEAQLVMLEIPNGNHADMHRKEDGKLVLDTANSYDYYRGRKVSFADATQHGGGNGAAVSVIDNFNVPSGFDGGTVGMSNVSQSIIENTSSATNADVSAVVAAINQTILNVKATGRNTVITCSADFNSISTLLEAALTKIDTTADVKSKIIIVFAAGNTNVPIAGSLTTPHTNRITVQANDAFSGVKSSYSNYGADVSFRGDNMDALSATNNFALTTVNGTSFAAPQFAAALVKLWSIPGFQNKSSRDMIALSAKDTANTNAFISNPNGTISPVYEDRYVIDNFTFSIAKDSPYGIGLSGNGGVLDLTTYTHDLFNGHTMFAPTYYYKKNGVGNWMPIPNGLLTKSLLGMGDHLVKLSYAVGSANSGICHDVVRKLKIVIDLPITWESVNAYPWGNDIAVKWESGMEINAKEYVVERSLDGVHFSPIGTVAAKGNSNTVSSYVFTDKDATKLQSNVVFYRLQEVDKDGQSNYSKIMSVKLHNASGIVIAPNPVVNQTRISLGSEAKIREVTILDLTGRSVRKTAGTGSNSAAVDFSGLPSGPYAILVIDDKGVRHTERVVKN